jgi:hypothetical protein
MDLVSPGNRSAWAASAIALTFTAIAMYYATDALPVDADLVFSSGKVVDLTESRGGVHVLLSGASGQTWLTYPHVNGGSGVVRRLLEQSQGAPVTLGRVGIPRRGLDTGQIVSVTIEGRLIRSATEVAKARWWNAAGLWAAAIASCAYAGWKIKRTRSSWRDDA